MNSIILNIYSGAGGRDAVDFRDMLLKMYFKYSQKNKWKVEYLDEDTLKIKGDAAFERLKNETGVHRLVRISPFDSKKLRHTSFVLVEVLPEIEEVQAKKINILDKDLKISFFRSSGPGGQNVNKRETAVRIVHLPTGLAVACQVERSQAANKEQAMKWLKSKLAKLMEKQQVQEVEKLKVKTSIDWGHQIRSYVFHPYKMVKDHRTGKKISKVEDVLEGNLEMIIDQ